MEIKSQDLMISSSVKYGTSSARGLVDNMTDFVCYVYTKGFLQYLETVGKLKKSGTEVAIAGDLCPGTNRIMEAVRQAGNLKYLDFYNPDKIEDVICKLLFKED